MSERKLATIEEVLEVGPIEGADAIERVRVRGWDVVVRKGEYEAGDMCVYFEVDSFLDVSDKRFEFLAPRGVRTNQEGLKGHALKTARLRGQYSQGLVMKPEEFVQELGVVDSKRAGEDVTEALKVLKWDPPISADLMGKVKGRLPSWIPTTDEERIQNGPRILECKAQWTPTEKIDGTSTTYYIDGEEDGVCTRSLDLIENPDNTLWKSARAMGIFDLMRSSELGERVAVQGETFGEGIQKNPLQMHGHHFRIFTIRVGNRELPRKEWPAWALEKSVPVHQLPFPENLEEALAQVENLKSAINPVRAAEGIVWRAADTDLVNVAGTPTRASFKVISNRYLLKNDN